MVKPASLWSMMKTCPDSSWVGDICRALGGQVVELDFGQQQMLAQIKQDSEWMDERIDEQKARWAQRQREKRARDKAKSRNVTDVTQCHGDIGDSHDVTIHPSIPPSIHPTPISKDIVVDNADDAAKLVDTRYVLPLPDMQKHYAAQVNVPHDYIETFNTRIREMGYQYINRNGATVNINRNNWKSVLRKFYEQDQKKALDKKKPGPQALLQPGYKAEMEMA